MLTERQRLTALHNILRSYANEQTTEDNKDVINTVCRKMAESDDITPKDYVLALSDGLKYGNWPWTSYNRQAEDRIHRQGQTVTKIFVDNSNIDKYMEEILTKKQESK